MSDLTKNPLYVAMAETVALMGETNDAKKAAKEEGTRLIDKVRATATLAASMGMDPKKTGVAFRAVAKAAGKEEGTVAPYATALQGYVTALAEGVEIDSGFGKDGDKPMTAGTAREFHKYTPAEREARAKLAAVRKEITEALARMTVLSELEDIRNMVVDLAPEKAEKGKKSEAPVDLDSIFGEVAEAA